MKCKDCKNNPVIITNAGSYCSRHFIKYFEKKVLKTIYNYKLLEKKENIGVACSGGKDSLSLLYLLNKFSKKVRGWKVTAISIDEGIKNYRNLDNVKKFCKENKIRLKIIDFKKEFGFSLDELVKIKSVYKPCSICGTFRRYLLNKYARKSKLSKLATGHNLDDEVQSILINQFRNNIARSVRLGPLTGVIKDERFVRRIKPFYFLSEKEVATYAFLKGLLIDLNECPYSELAYRNYVRDMLNNIEEKYPGTKNSVVNSFMEILPILKKQYKHGKINDCKICNEPCSQDVCNSCKLKKILKIKS